MKRILCYGDSNTWGYDPATQTRFGPDIRWTGVLARTLGDSYQIIEEGLNGRTTVWDDPIEGYKNGRDYLIPCLTSHKPLDLVIIMLGTNDLKMRFSVSAFDIAKSAGVLVDCVQASDAGTDDRPPPVLLMAPPPTARLAPGYDETFEGAGDKSRRLGGHYRQIAADRHCAFLDTATVITSSDLDGIHFEADEHGKLGQAVAEQVIRLLK